MSSKKRSACALSHLYQIYELEQRFRLPYLSEQMTAMLLALLQEAGFLNHWYIIASLAFNSPP
jgi:hypothetical protein